MSTLSPFLSPKAMSDSVTTHNFLCILDLDNKGGNLNNREVSQESLIAPAEKLAHKKLEVPNLSFWVSAEKSTHSMCIVDASAPWHQ
jgi:hypothetical protein